MKAARLLVLLIALGAGGIAALLAARSEKPSPAPAQIQKKADTVDVLVAGSDIALGQTLTPGDMKWQAWPASAGKGNFIRKQDRPGADHQLVGYVARMPFVAGEPIREVKLVNPKGAGVMAAILPPGTRAIATQISPESGAGGFILPNDRVDVIVTRKERGRASGDENMVSETVLTDVRVLAIDQMLEEKNGQKVVIGKTATLELTGRQAETLALAQRSGTIALALRSLADVGGKKEAEASDARGGINVVRFGVSTPASVR
jgi:pilus assembly protein CpaB